eukprot:358436-Chlamydomonas_euryale.AAC.6
MRRSSMISFEHHACSMGPASTAADPAPHPQSAAAYVREAEMLVSCVDATSASMFETNMQP